MYSRFKALERFGEEELEKLQGSTVAVVGLGATGSVIAEHLARHGVKLVLIDRDYLELNDCYSSNIYSTEDCEKALPKAEVAGEKLSEFTEVDVRVENLNTENIGLLEDVDLVMDGTDNLETRFLIAEYCRKYDLPWIYTSVLGEKGYSALFDKKCFNCIYDDVSPGVLQTCEEEGILREISTVMASKSALTAVKYLAGKKVQEKLESSSGETFDIQTQGCEVCSKERYPHLESSSTSISVCGDEKFQLEKEAGKEAREKLKEKADSFVENDYLVRAEVDGRTFTLFNSGRAIIEARDRGHAESIFSETVGV